MEIGSAIALCGVSASVGAIIITAIKSKKDTRERCHNDTCAMHSGVVACMDAIKKGMDRQEQRMSELADDIRMLLQRGGGMQL